MRYFVGVEYNGSHYYGFQSQLNSELPTIQEALEKAISSVADHPVEIVPAGRTDKGVHAKNQVIHFDTQAIRSDKAWLFGINVNLPKDISVKWIKAVPEDCHARFSATQRSYQYVIYNQNLRSALYYQRAALIYAKLDETKMHQAAQYFIGEHDFSSFRAAQCQAKTPIRNVTKFKVYREGDFIYCEVSANAFLHHMVRNMVGVLLEIGAGKKDISWAREVLLAKNRTFAGVTAPAEGLYLVGVTYPF